MARPKWRIFPRRGVMGDIPWWAVVMRHANKPEYFLAHSYLAALVQSHSAGIKLERGPRAIVIQRKPRSVSNTEKRQEGFLEDFQKGEHPTFSRSIGVTPLPKRACCFPRKQEQGHKMPRLWLDLPVAMVKKTRSLERLQISKQVQSLFPISMNRIEFYDLL